jgi:hypothetical protein
VHRSWNGDWTRRRSEVLPEANIGAADLPDRLRLERAQADLTDYDVFASICNKDKLALLASWRGRSAAERFAPAAYAVTDQTRHRIVRVVRDYSMFDRRESPQYYPQSAAKQPHSRPIPNSAIRRDRDAGAETELRMLQ